VSPSLSPKLPPVSVPYGCLAPRTLEGLLMIARNETTRHHSNKVLQYADVHIGHRTPQEVVMCAETDCKAKFGDLLCDPLIRLVMASDGVTEQEMLALRDQVLRALAARASVPLGLSY
jgi:hypothetical protein